MSTFAFVLVTLAIGLGYYLLFDRRRKNWQERNPGKKHNPIDEWRWGKRPDDDDEDEDRGR